MVLLQLPIDANHHNLYLLIKSTRLTPRTDNYLPGSKGTFATNGATHGHLLY
jgi:hypothetical protein